MHIPIQIRIPRPEAQPVFAGEAAEGGDVEAVVVVGPAEFGFVFAAGVAAGAPEGWVGFVGDVAVGVVVEAGPARTLGKFGKLGTCALGRFRL